MVIIINLTGGHSGSKIMPNQDATHEERLARTQRETDFPLTLILINPINRRLVLPLSRTGINPNTITWLSFLFNLTGAWALYQGTTGDTAWQIYAPILIFLGHVLDALDGDLARYTGRLSTYGEALDPILDRVSEAAFIFAIALGLFQAGGQTGLWCWALAAMGGDLIYYYTTDAQMNRVMGTRTEDGRRYLFTFGMKGKTRLKLGLYEPVKYILALGPLLGLALHALMIIAVAYWLGLFFQLVKLYRITRKKI